MSEKNKSDGRQKLLDEFKLFLKALEEMDETGTVKLLPWQKVVMEELLIGGGPEELAVCLARGYGRSVLADALQRYREENDMATDIVTGREACQEMLKVLGLENTDDVRNAVITMPVDDVVMLKVERFVDGHKFKTMLEDYYLVRRKDKEQDGGE